MLDTYCLIPVVAATTTSMTSSESTETTDDTPAAAAAVISSSVTAGASALATELDAVSTDAAKSLTTAVVSQAASAMAAATTSDTNNSTADTSTSETDDTAGSTVDVASIDVTSDDTGLHDNLSTFNSASDSTSEVLTNYSTTAATAAATAVPDEGHASSRSNDAPHTPTMTTAQQIMTSADVDETKAISTVQENMPATSPAVDVSSEAAAAVSTDPLEFEATTDEYDRLETADWSQLSHATPTNKDGGGHDYDEFDTQTTTKTTFAVETDESLDDNFWDIFNLTTEPVTKQQSGNSYDFGKYNGAESKGTKAWLVGSLLVGCILTATVIVMVSKRCYDSWQKRHYRKLDYLVNGMYN